MHSRATDRRSASKCQGKWPDRTLDQAFGLPEVLVAVSTSRLSCKRARKTRTLMPVWDSSGEYRIRSWRGRIGNRLRWRPRWRSGAAHAILEARQAHTHGRRAAGRLTKRKGPGEACRDQGAILV